MKGNDVELMRKFAKNLGVNVVFDQSSKSFNDTVTRAGAGDFDMAIGKLSTNYGRMSTLDNLYLQTDHLFQILLKFLKKI